MKTIHHLSCVALAWMCFIFYAQADVIATPAAQDASAITVVKDQYTFATLTPTIFSALTADQQKTIAEQWRLTADDYTRYLWLMNNTLNAFYYKARNLDPSWILGFNAKDEQERQKFVVIAIQNERDRIEKELAFQRDFTQLQQQLFPNQKAVNWSDDEATVTKSTTASIKK